MKSAVDIQTFSSSALLWALLVSWLGLVGLWLSTRLSLAEVEVGMALYGVFATSALVYLGHGRLTAWIGASAVGIGAFAFISEVIIQGLFSIIEPVRLLALALIFTGIVLERVSPKPNLESWMLMLIAAKAEFIIISSLMVSVLEAGHSLVETSVVIWWILIFLMLVSAGAFAFRSLLLYRTVLYASVVVSCSLLLVAVPLVSFSSAVTLWAVAATVWPPLAVLLVERTTHLHS